LLLLLLLSSSCVTLLAVQEPGAVCALHAPVY